MNETIKDILEFVKENDVKFIRLAFCDLFGAHKNISIMPDELPAAFEDAISFDASAIRGFGGHVKSDLFLAPDLTTMTVLPWRPGPGRVVRFYCDILDPNGGVFPNDCRQLLKRVIADCEKQGYYSKVGAECEFYLFKTDEDGEPTTTPMDKGGYMDIAPLDKCENIRREICLTLEEMGVKPEASHHEQGPGQNEIDFKFSDALACADNIITFKSVVKAISSRNGLFASFMPKPIYNAPGSGMHVNLSLNRNGNNIFKGSLGGLSAEAESFVAGILSKIPEITLFLNPLANSYERFGQYEAPRFVSWSHQNRSQLIRIPAAKGEKVRMELRSPDPSLNPYLALALIISAGIEGIEGNLPLQPALDKDLYLATDNDTKGLERLPSSLNEAIQLAEGSSFAQRILGKDLLDAIITEKKREAEKFLAAQNKAAFCKEQYFAYI